jgi:hypothetical protein
MAQNLKQCRALVQKAAAAGAKVGIPPNQRAILSLEDDYQLRDG